MIGDDNLCRFGLIVFITDFIGNLITDLDSAKDLRPPIRSNLLLETLLRNRILYHLKCILSIVSDLHRCRISAIDDLSLTSLRDKRSFPNSDRQCNLTFFSGCNIQDRPGYRAIEISSSAVGTDKFDIRIQLVPDQNICRLILIIFKADRIGDQITDFDSTKLSVSSIRCRLLFVGRVRNRILHNIQGICIIIADLHRSALAAVDYLPRSLFAFERAALHPHLQGDHTFFSGGDRRQSPCNSTGSFIIAAVIVRTDERHIRIQRIFDYNICQLCLIVFVMDRIGNGIPRLHPAKDSCSLVRKRLFLTGLPYRVLHGIHGIGMIVGHLHRCGIPAIYHFFRTIVLLQRTLQNAHRQRNGTLFSCRDIFQRPGNHSSIIGTVMDPAVTRTAVRNIRIERIDNRYGCRFLFIVFIGNLICNLLADSYPSQDTGSFIWSDFPLFRRWLLINVVYIEFQELIILVASDRIPGPSALIVSDHLRNTYDMFRILVIGGTVMALPFISGFPPHIFCCDISILVDPAIAVSVYELTGDRIRILLNINHTRISISVPHDVITRTVRIIIHFSIVDRVISIIVSVITFIPSLIQIDHFIRRVSCILIDPECNVPQNGIGLQSVSFFIRNNLLNFYISSFNMNLRISAEAEIHTAVLPGMYSSVPAILIDSNFRSEGFIQRRTFIVTSIFPLVPFCSVFTTRCDPIVKIICYGNISRNRQLVSVAVIQLCAIRKLVIKYDIRFCCRQLIPDRIVQPLLFYRIRIRFPTHDRWKISHLKNTVDADLGLTDSGFSVCLVTGNIERIINRRSICPMRFNPGSPDIFLSDIHFFRQVNTCRFRDCQYNIPVGIIIIAICQI